MEIEKLIEKTIEKKALPIGFEKGPNYSINKKKKWRKKKKI